MGECEETAFAFFQAHEQFAEAAEPTMGYLDHPAPCLVHRIAPFGVGFLAPVNDMRDVTMVLDGAKVFGAAIARVGAQMFAAPVRRVLALDDTGGEHLVKPLAVRDVGSGHDDRQPDATAVHQQVALAAFFRSVGFSPAACCASGAFIIAPSTLCQRQPMHCIWSHSARPAFLQRLKEAHNFPFQQALMDGACAAEALLGQRLPLAAGARHVDDGLQHQSSRLRRSAPTGLACLDPVSHCTGRKQRFYPLPELIGYHPGRYTFGRDLDPAPRTMRLESIGYLFMDKFLVSNPHAVASAVLGQI